MKEDLVRELEKISKAESFLAGGLFEEENKMDEAYQLTHHVHNASIHGRSINKSDFVPFMKNTVALIAKKKSIGNTQMTLARATGMSIKRPFTSVLTILILSLILKCLIALGFLLMLLVDQEDQAKQRHRKCVSEGHGRHFLFAPDLYLSMMYSPATINIIEDRKTFFTPAEVSGLYQNTLETFITDVENLRTQVKQTIGANTSFEILMFGDMCSLLEDDPNDLEATAFSCKNLNYKIGTTGFIKYCIAEQSEISTVQSQLGIQLANMTFEDNAFDANPFTVNQPIVDIWYEQDFTEIRQGHHVLANHAMNITLDTVNSFLTINNQSVSSLMMTLRILGIIFVTIPFLIFLVVTIRFFQRDYLVALYTFEIMSPDTILTNQYILAIFNRFFQTANV